MHKNNGPILKEIVMSPIYIRFRRVAVGLVALALTACSGGGGGSSNFFAPAGITTATISGSVSGSTFVAVDVASNAETGRIAASADATGGKSFSLPLPPGRTYKFYLIEMPGPPMRGSFRSIKVRRTSLPYRR
jgi:hypothetical protein